MCSWGLATGHQTSRAFVGVTLKMPVLIVAGENDPCLSQVSFFFFFFFFLVRAVVESNWVGCWSTIKRHTTIGDGDEFPLTSYLQLMLGMTMNDDYIRKTVPNLFKKVRMPIKLTFVRVCANGGLHMQVVLSGAGHFFPESHIEETNAPIVEFLEHLLRHG